MSPPVPPPGPWAYVEVGGSGCQTVLLGPDGPTFLDGARPPAGHHVALAVPGLVHDDGTVSASNLGWRRVDPAAALGLAAPAGLLRNDAVAAALGEAALRPAHRGPLVYLGLGTGIGGAVVDGGRVVAAELFGHAPGFGDRRCPCGQRGCLETVAAGWALPAPLDPAAAREAAAHLARAVRAEPGAARGPVVVTGGLAAAHPELVDLLADQLPDRRVETSARPAGAKSAAAWGLRASLAAAPNPAPT